MPRSTRIGAEKRGMSISILSTASRRIRPSLDPRHPAVDRLRIVPGLWMPCPKKDAAYSTAKRGYRRLSISRAGGSRRAEVAITLEQHPGSRCNWPYGDRVRMHLSKYKGCASGALTQRRLPSVAPAEKYGRKQTYKPQVTCLRHDFSRPFKDHSGAWHQRPFISFGLNDLEALVTVHT